MTPLVISILCLAMVGTSFLSGIFGMAGGMILVGILLAIMPVPEAMMLHGVTQMASNGWRGLLWWRHVRWSVAGPLLDQFFLGGKFDRREIVATKAICQIFGHGAKLIYFGSLIDQAVSR